MSDDLQWYLVEGLNPEPWVASEASVGRKGGKTFVRFHKPQDLALYQESLKDMFKSQNPHAVERPGDIQVMFFFWRELVQYELHESGGRQRRSHVADATNLQKSTEDALQGILYKNDRNIVSVTSTIVAQALEVVPAILIAIGSYDTQTRIEERSTLEDIRESLTPPPVEAGPQEDRYASSNTDSVF